MNPDDNSTDDQETPTTGYPLADIEDPRPVRTEYDPFVCHQLSEAAGAECNATRARFKGLRDVVVDTVPPCRERSLAVTYLQIALMLSIQAIACTHPDSEPIE